MPETLCFTWFLQDFESKKKTPFGARVGSILEPPEPKTLYFTMLLTILQGLFLGSKKEKTAQGAPSMGRDGFKSPSHGPDSTDQNTPNRTDDRRTFAYVIPPR